MFVDSHCHLDFPDFAGELPRVLDAMRAAEVTHALCISVDLPDWPRVHALAAAHANLYATAGTHPDYPDTEEPTVARLLRRLDKAELPSTLSNKDWLATGPATASPGARSKNARSRSIGRVTVCDPTRTISSPG